MKNPLLFSLLVGIFLILNTSAKASCYGDYTPPVAICDAHTVVALGADGIATVYAYNLDDGSYDNCEIDNFMAARMWQGWCPYGVADDTQFRPYVQFCCEDVGAGPIWIQVKVTDTHGNSNTCMVQVTVQDSPGNLHCPYDKTIYCDYWFDWNDLYDPWNSFFGWPTGGGGCNNPDVNVEIHDLRNSCGVGVIKRIFSTGGGGYGYGGYDDQCIQKIHVVNYHPFGGYINWPEHYTADGCDHYAPHPDNLPHGYDYPTWDDNNCSMIGYNYEDQVFTFVEGVCKKVLRKWTIIDWCTYDPHHPYHGGIWTYTQVIKLVDHGKPWFENCHDVTVSGEEEYCKGRFKHHPEVWDDCTPQEYLKYEYKIDLWGNGSYDIIKHGHKYIDEVLPSGTHKALWYVDDGCGNVNSCWFYVHVHDKKPPTPICFANLSTVVMPLGGMVTIWARDFDASSFDNCTPAHQLKFSFSPDVHEGSRTFTCDDVGLVALKVYVTDAYGNQAYCNTFITITDNGPICPEMNGVTGTIEMFTAEAVEGATVELHKVMPDGSLVFDMARESAADGSFKVGFGTTNFDRRLVVTKSTNPMAGINLLDLIDLQKHIFGSALLSHPAALRAADVDGSGRAGVNDLLALRNIVVSGGLTLAGAPMPWEFYPSNCEWNADGTPTCQFDVHINKDLVQSPYNFTAYKLGDLNGSVMQDPLARLASFPVGVRYDAEKQAYAFIALRDIDMLGVQMSAKSPVDFESTPYASGELTISDLNTYVNNEERMVNMVWSSPVSKLIREGETMFYLQAPEGNGQGLPYGLNKGMFRNEIYMANRTALKMEFKLLGGLQNPATGVDPLAGETQDVASQPLTFRSGAVAPALQQPFFAPNPMQDAGLLYFELAENQSVSVEIYTADQKLVYSRDIDGTRGLNEVSITSSQIGKSGVYLYRLTIGDQAFTGRIVSLD